MAVRLVLAGKADAGRFLRVAEDVFDGPPHPALVEEFLADPRHHMILACDGDTVIGMVSAVHYIHPDKPAQMWINELGVAPTHRRKGIATRLVAGLCEHAVQIGCTEAWVVSDPTDEALRFYQSLGAPQTGSNLAMFTFPLSQP